MTVASARVGVLVFPGTNSEDETLRACEAVGLGTELVHWKTPSARARRHDALVLPGGFAYEDRVRAGAIAAHDALMEVVREFAAAGKPVLGICNGAQILAEAGLVPGFGGDARPQAGFARNGPTGRFVCRRVYLKLAVPPERCVFTRHLAPGALITAWAAHGEGRLAAPTDVRAQITAGDYVAFVYADERGEAGPQAVPNASALGAAALTNVAGNVLAVMPHPERDAWTFMHRDGPQRAAAAGDVDAMLGPSGGIALFAGLAGALS